MVRWWSVAILFLVFGAVGYSPASGQDPEEQQVDTLSLRFSDGSNPLRRLFRRTLQVRADEPFVLTVTGLVPKWKSAYIVDVQRVQVSPLPKEIDSAVKLQTARNALDCLDDAFNTVNEAESEEEADELILEAARKAAEEQCPDDVLGHLLQASTRVVRQYTLKGDDELDIVVRRDGAESRFRITTDRGGDWLTSYGFVFFPHRSDRYGAEENPDEEEGGYVITDHGQKRGGDAAGAAVFHWVPRRWRGNAVVPSLTGGFGVNSSEPLVLAGLGLSYRTNITFLGGILGHRQGVVRPQYSDGQVIQEKLEPDQIIESTFRRNWYVGLAVRFGSNPFASASDAEPSESDGEDEPDDEDPNAQDGDGEDGDGEDGDGNGDADEAEGTAPEALKQTASDAALNPETFRGRSEIENLFESGQVLLCQPDRSAVALNGGTLTMTVGVEESELAQGASRDTLVAAEATLASAIRDKLVDEGFSEVTEVRLDFGECS